MLHLVRTDRSVIQKEAFFASSIANVWEALTSAEDLQEWLMREGEFSAEPGKRFIWQGLRSDLLPSGDYEVKVEEVEKEKQLVFRLRHLRSDQISFVIWSLEPKGDGTVFRIHQWFLDEDEAKPHPTVIVASPSALLHRQLWIWSWDSLLRALLRDLVSLRLAA